MGFNHRLYADEDGNVDDMMTEDEVQDTDDEVGCWVDRHGEEHHGIACQHPSCSDCGAILTDGVCGECGWVE
jgi:hypothetical protein